MSLNKKLLKASSVLCYIFVAIWFIAAAVHFSLRSGNYWIDVLLAFALLWTGINVKKLSDTILDYSTIAGNKSFIFCWIISLAALPSFVLNTITFCRRHREEKQIQGNTYKRRSLNKKISGSGISGKKGLVIGLCITLLSSAAAMMFETTHRSVKVSNFDLTKDMTEKYNKKELNGKSYVIDNPKLKYSVNMYVPKDASTDHKLPAVFVMPGFTRTKESMAQYCIEFSRRDAVVFSLDPGSQGGTTYAGYDEDGERISPTVEANGLNYLVQYVYNNEDDFAFIDKSKIGAIGHSAGGGNVAELAENFAGDSFDDSVIKSLFISGYIKVSSVNRYANLHSNTVLDYAQYDEGNFRYQEDTSAFEPISLRFINEVDGSDAKYDEVIQNYEYGDMADGTYRLVLRDPIIHSMEMYEKTGIAHSIKFFAESLGLNKKVSENHQVWFGKELFNGIALIGAFMIIVYLSKILVNTKFFASIKGEEKNRNTEMPATAKSGGVVKQGIFWSAIFVTAIIACIDYIPLAYLSMNLFEKAAGNEYTYFFPARMVNAVMLWALVNGTIGLVIFALTNMIEKKLDKSTSKVSKNIKISFSGFMKTLLLSVILFLAFYVMVEIVSLLFHQDFRFMMISASPLNKRFLVTWLIYIPVFFIFYIGNSIRVNCSIAERGWKEWQVNLVGGLANSVGLMFILVIQYISFTQTGTVYYGYYGSLQKEVWLYINMVIPLIPMMFLLPIMNRIFYKQTKQVWLGPLTTCMIFIMMTLSASVSYIPM